MAPARLVGHCATQVYYDDAWHLMDGDMHVLYLLRDNETVAGEQDLVRDHDLVRRTHTRGLLEPDHRAGDEKESSLYVFEGKIAGDRNSAVSAMNLTLRPSEAVVWRWGHLEPVKYHGARPSRFPDRICNGLWEYRPDFTRPTWRGGTATVESIRASADGLAAEPGTTGAIVWTMHMPYVIVGGRLEVEPSGARFELSWDGKTWHEVKENLDADFPHDGPARYTYHLKCTLADGATLRRLGIVNDLQMAPLSLPGCVVGANAFTYTDESSDRRVQITHEWVERSASRPPDPPAAPIQPTAGGEVEGTDVVFRWQPAVDPDGDRIGDYHFELSARPDMKWPLSMSFAKLISRTSKAGQARYSLPTAGLLNPDTTYYWHVRARDDKGVWGPWSKTWNFTPRGPAPPRDVALAYDPQSGRGTLRWARATKGRTPVSYRVYASDEKGFSVSDTPYNVTVGVSTKLPGAFPSNFIGETSAAEFEVIRADLPGGRLNRVYYRVVAVDAQGHRSGPSDFAEARRPVICGNPVIAAATGVECRAPLAVIRSLGDLRTRVVGGKETMNFWDVESPRFAIERGPAWLAIDPSTGLLSGTPDRPGTFEVIVSVALEREAYRLDEPALRWGVEKVLSRGTEPAGRASRQFTINVRP